jgi:hypothetical protein
MWGRHNMFSSSILRKHVYVTLKFIGENCRRVYRRQFAVGQLVEIL